ncbi:MAG: 4-hydroxyphenylpyruvate dioxygenase [Myxococcales bacterium]|nr:4-hydroxyphenylpyruvate dioxygenase [Myxococcales bacterium]MCB9520554.1 4-hydroxyphenylpyruvate dioxygenase [Myxococcales bacterium]MCB9532597.1 4-hydroxyphenylpyruvate dioxygenase [Myxococcales bacterium]MCB9532698.1 4-hydroxyphenylpyruvate dioxygenase [Myxococcales bacterium]
MVEPKNPLGMRGIDFVEFADRDLNRIGSLLRDFGFSRERRHRAQRIELWRQGEIRALVAAEPGSFADQFQSMHGPSISALGFRVDDARAAYDEALRRGARGYMGRATLSVDVPAIYGVGDSLIYFVDRWSGRDGGAATVFDARFEATGEEVGPGCGFVAVDHLTNNVEKGTLRQWADFYERVFGFTEVRHFDIRGAKTGLYSFALRSPDGSFCIPINEGTDSKSQIEEYLREYNGPGIQHLAFLTDDLLGSLDAMRGRSVDFLDIDATYYDSVFDRVPNVTESRERIVDHQVLVDGDDEGYLLQIFTKNLLGPIFVELIQRRNHLSFGEGNFGALFRSIERDQERRGVI